MATATLGLFTIQQPHKYSVRLRTRRSLGVARVGYHLSLDKDMASPASTDATGGTV